MEVHHIETSPLICIAKQWTGFYMIGSSVTPIVQIQLGLRWIKTEASLSIRKTSIKLIKVDLWRHP